MFKKRYCFEFIWQFYLSMAYIRQTIDPILYKLNMNIKILHTFWSQFVIYEKITKGLKQFLSNEINTALKNPIFSVEKC